MKRVDVVARSNLSLPAKWLAVFMLRHANRRHEVTATMPELIAWTALDRRVIWSELQVVEASGFLTNLSPFKRGERVAATWKLGPELCPPTRHTPDENVRPRDIVVSAHDDIAALTPREGVRADLVSSSYSPGLLSSPVQENKELRQESVTETPATQPALISVIDAEWIEPLRELAAVKVGVGQRASSADDAQLVAWAQRKGHSPVEALNVALQLQSKWPKLRHTDVKATFRDWLNRGFGRNGNGKSQGHVSPIEAGRAGGFADSSRYET